MNCWCSRHCHMRAIGTVPRPTIKDLSQLDGRLFFALQLGEGMAYEGELSVLPYCSPDTTAVSGFNLLYMVTCSDSPLRASSSISPTASALSKPERQHQSGSRVGQGVHQ